MPITTRGWYRSRGGAIREVEHSTAYRSDNRKPSVILLLREKACSDDRPKNKFEITFDYAAARAVIASWQRYMAEYPEKENA